MNFLEGHRLFLAAAAAMRPWRHLAVHDQVFFGSKYVNGSPTSTAAIRFNVKTKKPRSALSAAERIPAKIGKFVTDVNSFRFTQASGHLLRTEPVYGVVRPLLGGVQIQGSIRKNPLDRGTLGAIISVGNQSFGITNHHVLYGADGSVAAGKLYQPARSNFGKEIGLFSTIAGAALDYALIDIRVPVDQLQSINGLPGLIEGYILAQDIGSLSLVKSGAGSGITQGIFDARSLTQSSTVLIRAISGRVSRPGDSGSVWVQQANEGLQLFALHTGGESSGHIAVATLFSSIWPSIQANMKQQSYRARAFNYE